MKKEIVDLLREFVILLIWAIVIFFADCSEDLKWAFSFGYLVYLGITDRLERLLAGEGVEEYFERQGWPNGEKEE